MDVNNLVNRAKNLANQGAEKAKHLASENSGTVNSGLSKAEHFVNSKTGGKYSQQIAKGREGISNALGVPGTAKHAYDEERSGPVTPSRPVDVEPVDTDPIAHPDDIDKPRPV